MSMLSLGRLQQLLKKELRQMFRDPRMKAVIFVAPIVQLMVFGYAVNTDIRDTALYVVDQDKSATSRELVDAFTATGYFDIVGRSDRPSDLALALDRGDAVVGVEIPAGFAADLARGTSSVQVLVDGTNSNTGTVAQGYAGQIVQRYATEYMQHVGKMPSGGVDLRTRAWYNPELESRVYNVPGVVGVLVMLMGLLLTSLAVVRERELGTLDQLLVSPLSATELILGKTIPVMLVGLIQITLISCVAVLWFKIPLRGSVLVLLPAALLYILAGISLGLIISTISKTQQEAFMVMFLVLFPIVILSGFMFPVDSMAAFFGALSLLDPIRHFVEIVRSLFLKGEGFGGLWRQYLALAIIATSALAFAVARLRRSAT
jgi:ABC-2 type transport system permease protein